MALPLRVYLLMLFAFFFRLLVRSLFIWRPKDDHELAEQKDERKIVICTGTEKKRKHKSKNDDSDDDSDVDKSTLTAKGKNFKSRKPATEMRKSSQKTKR